MRQPRPYEKGEKVRDIYTGQVYTVKENMGRQEYAGGDTADYTILLESIDPSQPTPWNKSRNLEPVARFPFVDGVKAHIDNCGKVSIEYESQGWSIPAPGEKTKYLPCDKNCGRLLVVNCNVVSACCEDCYLREYE